MRAKVIAFVALATLLMLWAAPAYGQEIPPLPHAFYGTVKINNSSAPVGTRVEAMTSLTLPPVTPAFRDAVRELATR